MRLCYFVGAIAKVGLDRYIRLCQYSELVIDGRLPEGEDFLLSSLAQGSRAQQLAPYCRHISILLTHSSFV